MEKKLPDGTLKHPEFDINSMAFHVEQIEMNKAIQKQIDFSLKKIEACRKYHEKAKALFAKIDLKSSDFPLPIKVSEGKKVLEAYFPTIEKVEDFLGASGYIQKKLDKLEEILTAYREKLQLVP